MAYIYAMSDIRGYLDAFEETLSVVDLTGENRLILLGGLHGFGSAKLWCSVQSKRDAGPLWKG